MFRNPRSRRSPRHRHSVLVAVVATVVGITVGAGLLAAVPGAATAEGRSGAASDDGLALVREATARYHDPQVALAEGFVSTHQCTASPAGAMGIHFVNPARMADPAIRITEPEELVYEPQTDGSLRLVAVEWFRADPDQNLATDEGRPSLLGRAFDGPMPGHTPGMPIHFDLHAWVWRHNPSGDFAPWNPKVHCP